MNIDEKKAIVATIVEKLQNNSHFYVTDSAGLNAENTSKLRRKCFDNDVELLVVKNTLFRKALEQVGGNEYAEMYPTLIGNSTVMFANAASLPAKLIKEIRKEGKEKPFLKSAFVEECIYVGDCQLDALVAVKSKNELIGEVIGLLQSPMQSLIGALNSGGNTIAGIVKTLSEKE
jgi:large subunit ribosomal protein L10